MKINQQIFLTRLRQWVLPVLMLAGAKGFSQTQTLVSHNFSSQCSLPSGWRIENVDGGCTWRCDAGGFTQNNHSSQGCSGAANDWLIFPMVDFSAYINEVVNVSVTNQYAGGSFALRFSSTYPGTGNPNNYVWSTVYTFSAGITTNISLSAFDQPGYLAFLYTSSGSGTNQAARWTINSVNLTGEPALLIDNLKISGIGTVQASVEAEVLNDGGMGVTERGFLWSVSPNPLLNGAGVNKVTVSGGLGQYSSILSGLPSGTRIYVKGFASNASMSRYTSQKDFYTLSEEPMAYPATFTATTTSKNSIRLDWSQVNDASGYLILMREQQPPAVTPKDASGYAYLEELGNGTVAALVFSGSTTSTEITDLVQGTRFYFTLFPFHWDGNNDPTLNYKTNPTIPLATDSTWGLPPSKLSVVAGIAGTEALEISSLQNEVLGDSSKGTQVWQLRLLDGGSALSDPDDLPTILQGLTLQKGLYNTVANWQSSLKAAILIDDSTGAILANGVIGASAITFSNFSLTAADDNYRNIRLKISLREIAHIDRSLLQWEVNTAGVLLARPLYSSQAAGFVSTSDSSANKIQVEATRLVFVNNPAVRVETGAYLSSAIQVAARDVYNGLDLDYTGNVSLEASAGNLLGLTRTVTAQQGVALFDTIRFDRPALYDTLLAGSGILIPARGTRFEVEVSKRSDIVTEAFFAYPQNFRHLDYQEATGLGLNNSLEVFAFWLRDGGASGDADFQPTALTRLDINLTNPQLLRSAALFAGSRKLAETSTVLISGSTSYISFTSLDTAAMDNDSIRLSLRMTFKALANDGDRLSFTIREATQVDTLSRFALTTAGGALSSTLGNNNRIDVRASRLVFASQPGTAYRGSILLPSVLVMALDSAGNKDMTGRVVNMEVLRSAFAAGARSTEAITSIRQGAVFDELIFSLAVGDAVLVARSTGLDSVVSDTFDIRIPVWYRSINSGNWSDLNIWETSTDYGISWTAAGVVPDYEDHGRILIQSGDTVQMDGTTAAENTVDELVVESGAVLITPDKPGTFMTVNNGAADDVVIWGTLEHRNGSATQGLQLVSGASLRVKAGASLVLAAYGDARHWAGNSQIYFEDQARYVHRTASPNTIGSGVLFPNAETSVKPVFVVGENNNYSWNQPLLLNGVLEVAPGKTFTLGGTGVRSIRNGIVGEGTLRIQDQADVRITGLAELRGDGHIDIVSPSASFRISSGSETVLRSNKTINSTGNQPFLVEGILVADTLTISGNTDITLANGATLYTAHRLGLNGTFATIGNRIMNPLVNYVFNGTEAQVSGLISSQAAASLQVDNLLGLTLTEHLTVSDTVEFKQGKIVSGATALLSVSGNILGGDAQSYVQGPLRRFVPGMETRVFPVGSAIYGEVSYYSTASQDGWVTMEYKDENPHTRFDTTQKGAGLASIRSSEYWEIAVDNGLRGQVEIDYTSNSQMGGTALENIRVIAWDGQIWQSEGPLKRNASSDRIRSNTLRSYGAFTLGIDSACQTPSVPVFSSTRICEGSDLLLQALAQGTLQWYENAQDEFPRYTGNSVFVSGITTDTVFYVESRVLGCVSSRVSYPVLYQQKPMAPQVNGNRNLCFEEAVQLSTPFSQATYWYVSDSAQSPVFIGSAYTSALLQTDTIFYAQAMENGCLGDRSAVRVQVRARVESPYTVPASICEGEVVTLKVSANENVSWFSSLDAPNFFTQGEKWTSPVLNRDTTYYVEAVDGNCRSERVPVSVEVNPRPEVPVVSAAAICEGNAVKLSASGKNLIWLNDSNASIALANGADFTTPVLFSSRKYYVRANENNCRSFPVALPVTVYTYPTSLQVNMPASVPANEPIVVQTTGTASELRWDFGLDAMPSTAIGPGPHQVLWSSRGEKTITLTAWNGNPAVRCEQVIQSSILVQTGLSVDETNAPKAVAYPNPVEGYQLFIRTGTSETVQLSILDAAGKKIMDVPNYVSDTPLFTQGWAPGMYLVRVQSGCAQQVVKVVLK